MSDVLFPLRHVYGVEPHEAARPGEAGYGEQEALRELHRVLDALPLDGPPPAVLEAVLARAAEPAPPAALDAESPVERAVFDQSLRALTRLERSSPRADVLEAVLARAAEASATADLGLEAESPVEAAVLDQSLQVLDRAERPAPRADVLEAVLAFAANHSDALAAVRRVYVGEPGGDAVEVAVLEQTRDALDRAFASRPQPRPSADVVDAVLARAAEASALEVTPALEGAPVEAALLAQSYLALDRLPRSSASPAVLDAVRVAAATATAESAPATAPAAVPTPMLPSSRPSRWGAGWWAGAGALVLAAVVAVVALPQGGAGDATPEIAAVAVAETEPAEEFGQDAATPIDTRQDTDLEAPVAPSAPGPAVASAAISGFIPVAESVARRPAPRTARSAEPPAVTQAPSAAAAVAASAPAWDTPDDVRALSMRLEELDLEDAFDWEEPAETFGVPAARARTSSPGVQAVRDGAAPLPASTDSTQQR